MIPVKQSVRQEGQYYTNNEFGSPSTCIHGIFSFVGALSFIDSFICLSKSSTWRMFCAEIRGIFSHI